LGSTARAHSAGETIQQISSKATGPNGGPYATMTADVTPRRVQNFTKGTTNGQIPSCVVTPFGAGPSTLTPTVANGIFTLPAITINSGGVTSVGCS